MTVLFVSENVRQITAYVDTFLRCSAVSFVFRAVVNVYRNGIQGMGYGIMPITAGIATGRTMHGSADCVSFWKLYGNLPGKPDGMGIGSRFSDRYVLLYYWIIRQYRIKGLFIQKAGEHNPAWKKKYT